MGEGRTHKMLDLKLIRNNPDLVRAGLTKRGAAALVDELLDLDEERRDKLAKVEALKNKRNVVSKEVGRLKAAKVDATNLINEMKAVNEEIKQLDGIVRSLEEKINDILYSLPNLPQADVPVGPDEAANVEIRRWGEPRSFSFEPKPHWELGEKLNLFDFDQGAKISGARFTVLKGL